MSNGNEQIHAQDSDCTPDETSVCTSCGVLRGPSCINCGGKSFHLPTCTDSVEDTIGSILGEGWN